MNMGRSSVSYYLIHVSKQHIEQHNGKYSWACCVVDTPSFDQEAWFEVVLLRSKIITETVVGNVSAIVAAALGVFFDEAGHDMQKAGIQVTLKNGTSHHLFFKLGMVLADEAALHAVYCCKGSGGLKPCMLCQNIFNQKLRPEIIEGDRSGWAQPHTCNDYAKLVLHTSSSIRAILNRLSTAQANMTKGEFQELEIRFGWNLIPNSLLMNISLFSICCPSEVLLYDWMHVLFVSGVFNVHMGYLMVAMKEFGITYTMLHEYTLQFTWPFLVGNGARDVMCPQRAKSSWKDGSLKATASEGLSLVPVLATFFHEVERKTTNLQLSQHCTCFGALVRIIETIQKSTRAVIDCDLLQRYISTYMSSFEALYSRDAMPIKFHLLVHFPAFMRKWGSLPNCFALERKHKTPKRFGNAMQSTTQSWDASILREVTSRHIATLTADDCQHFCVLPGLSRPQPVNRKLNSELQNAFGAAPEVCFSTSKVARINEYERCAQGDVVRVTVNDEVVVGRILLHLSVKIGEETLCFTSLERWELVENCSRFSRWRKNAHVEACFCKLADIQCVLIWSASGNTIRTLKPLHGS